MVAFLTIISTPIRCLHAAKSINKRERPFNNTNPAPVKKARTDIDTLEVKFENGQIIPVNPEELKEFHQWIDETLYPARTHNLKQPLFQLPGDILTTEILPNLKQEDALNASAACRRMHQLFSPELLFDKLLQSIVYDDQKTAESIIAKNPTLLLKSGKTNDYSGRTIIGTPLQAALGSDNIKYGENEERMVEMILRHFKTLAHADTEIKKQITEQFPKDWGKTFKKKQAQDLHAIKLVMHTIHCAQSEYDCKEAIQAFRDYLDHENKNKAFTAGKHFNHQILSDGIKEIAKLPEDRRYIAHTQVIAYILNYIPACTVWAAAEGITGVQIKEAHTDYKEFYKDKFYYPLNNKTDQQPARKNNSVDVFQWGTYTCTTAIGDIVPFEAFQTRKNRNLQSLFEQYEITHYAKLSDDDIDTRLEKHLRSSIVSLFGNNS